MVRLAGDAVERLACDQSHPDVSHGGEPQEIEVDCLQTARGIARGLAMSAVFWLVALGTWLSLR